MQKNLTVSALLEQSILRREGLLNRYGALVVNTGAYTGRSPNDKFTVKDNNTNDSIWWGSVNQAMSPARAENLYQRITHYLNQQDQVFQTDCFAGADPTHRLSVRVITQRAWHAIFAHNMFIMPPDLSCSPPLSSSRRRGPKPDAVTLDSHLRGNDDSPEFTVIHAPGFKADPTRDGTRSEAAIVVDFTNRRVLICGTEYAGEIKKSIFTVLNYLLPEQGVLGMHCSANVGNSGDVAIFFGLSGTGKTTLSADQDRNLIGDDEHGWNNTGVFNFEGGCYAKIIRLSHEDEPIIFATTKQFGTILENVVIDEQTRILDLNDTKYTENTRASYELSCIPNVHIGGMATHPKNIIMLTADAFGVLPPIARLSGPQAMYHFLSGYTARVAGTERGVKQPEAVFSACFGAPFMARHPSVYAKLLGERMQKHSAQCWLVNTGWSGGGYGVGNRMKIAWTRMLLKAALSGELEHSAYRKDEFFKIEVPISVPGVPSEILDPRQTWKDKVKYDETAKKLVELFRANFLLYASQVSGDVLAAQI